MEALILCIIAEGPEAKRPPHILLAVAEVGEAEEEVPLGSVDEGLMMVKGS